MNRSDYKTIAAIVARHVYDLNDAGIALVSELTDYLEADNERFDRARFVDACVDLCSHPVRPQVKAKTYAALALDNRKEK